MTRDRSFYRQFFTLCLTLMAERLVVCSVNLLDNIMLGSYAETAMAAAAAVNQLQFLFQQLIYATGAGMVILGGQYWAQGQWDQVRRIVPIGLRWVQASPWCFSFSPHCCPGSSSACLQKTRP